jgi:nucleotide-binding universal stress UspA family protein
MLPNIKTILYATDVGPAGPRVFSHAMGLAKCYKAGIIVLSVLEPLGAFGEALVDSYVAKETLKRLRREGEEKVIAELRDRVRRFCNEELADDPHGLELVRDVRVLAGNPAEVILKQAKKEHADVIVMGSHGHTAFGEMLLGSVAHKVTQRSEIPVLLVPARK